MYDNHIPLPTPPPQSNYSEAVFLSYYIMNTLSLLGQLFIIITYFSIRKKSNNFYSYVACHCYISFPWLITNYTDVPLGSKKSPACTAMGFINTTSYAASMIWSSVIAWVIFYALRNHKKIEIARWYYPVIVCTIAFFFVLFALIRNGYGPSYGVGIVYCWFDDSLSTTVSYWVPFIATSAFDIIFYVRSICIVNSQTNKETSKAFLILLLFPLIQIFCNSGEIVRRIAEYMGESEDTYLEVLHFICAKGQGLYEALAYGMNPAVRAEIAKVWCKKRAKELPPAQDQNKSIEMPLSSSSSINSDSIALERGMRSVVLEL